MTTTVTPQPNNFTASFAMKVYALHTTTVDGMDGVIKRVDWTMIGSEEGQTFELPQTTDLNNPQPDLFIPLHQVEKENVVQWLEANDTRIPSIKLHIQMVLDKEVARAALTPARLPWLESSQATPVAEPSDHAGAPLVAPAA